MEIFIKANGRMIKPKVMEFTCTRKLERNMKDIGRMICSMDRVYKYMQMETSIKECLNKAKEADKVLII
jgi:hypothetical protein